MVNPKLHHVAVVVADLDEALTRYQMLGFCGSERFVLAEQAVEVATLRSGTGWIELIRPTDPNGPIARFLAKRGEGVHHVAYAVPNIIAALKGLEAAGIRLIDAAPRTGAHGWRIAFIHPESCGGVLTELVQE
jgi:methylmalonyl-CoA/ethylmalonyl-CoA epimerase